jgi:hypothetical protein
VDAAGAATEAKCSPGAKALMILIQI